MIIPVVINSRPFSVELITGLMLPDGIFDGSLTRQSINCHVTNPGSQDLKNVDVYLEGIGDPGIVPDVTLQTIPMLRAGSSYLCSWPCDFSQASPGKTIVSLRIQSAGFAPARILKKIFVSRMTYDFAHDEYVCKVPEGILKLQVTETSGPPVEYIPGPGEPVRKRNAGPWIIRGLSAELAIGFKGQYGPLAFNDPWWKVVAWIIAAIAAIVAVVAASRGHGTASADVKCDYDEKTGGFTNCRSPDPEPTTGPSEVTIAGIASELFIAALNHSFQSDIWWAR
jgi:hypothetical protein